MAKKKARKKPGGLVKYQRFVKSKTKAKTARVKKIESALKKAKRTLEAARKKASRAFKRKRK